MTAPSRSILVAVDGSRHAAAALRFAIDIAQRDGARLTLIHVLTPGHTMLITGPYVTAPVETETTAEAEQMLDRLAGTVPEGISVHTIVRNGNPPDEILRRADGSQHDLIVIGSRGHGVAASALLGSVSRAVVHHSAVPVLVVHVESNAESGRLHPPGRRS